ncbi:MAG: cystathionine beta-lyase, partial [Firmicutes bacterium]|nr:cystathionine beta-lyase [Bacillota bacterium]
MAYDFDSIIERRRTKSMKWDALEELFGQKDLIPLWVADMDFKSPPEVIEAVIKRAEHGIFGYAGSYDSYFTAVVNWLKRRFQWEVEKEWIVPCPG